jgi:hypothetical protein
MVAVGVCHGAHRAGGAFPEGNTGCIPRREYRMHFPSSGGAPFGAPPTKGRDEVVMLPSAVRLCVGARTRKLRLDPEAGSVDACARSLVAGVSYVKQTVCGMVFGVLRSR